MPLTGGRSADNERHEVNCGKDEARMSDVFSHCRCLGEFASSRVKRSGDDSLVANAVRFAAIDPCLKPRRGTFRHSVHRIAAGIG